MKLRTCKTLRDRMKGLMGVKKMKYGDGIKILNCRCIHTCFMHFPINVVFLDKKDRPVKIMLNVKPWRLFIWGGWKARKVIETCALR
ncbi:MAG: DUF192 domain-containing protein [Kiritimatiellae bacterium]|nr:DUF192 domain-containing protein [Kiritimatiellia bacterium]